MSLINKRVEHIKYGPGIVTDAKEHVICVKFQDSIGLKSFLYPEAFEQFLKATGPETEKYVLEALRIRKEQVELEKERKREENEARLEAAELEKKKERLERAKKKSASKPKIKKT